MVLSAFALTLRPYRLFFLGPSSAEPRNGFDVGHKPRAEGEDNGNEDDDIIPTAKDAATKAEVSELVEIQHGIVTHEIDHRVLSNKVDARNARHVGCDEKTCQTAKDDGGVGDGDKDISCKSVAAHGIGGVVENEVTDRKSQNHDEADKKCSLAPHPIHREVPETSQLEVVNSHEKIVELHPQGIAQHEHPVTEEGETYVENTNPGR